MTLLTSRRRSQPRQLALTLAGLLSASAASAADLATELVGSWTMVSHTVSYEGTTFDAHAALLQQRPCAAKIRYLLNADGSYRLDASASGCDDKYRAIQEKLYAKTRWRLEGNKLSTSSTNFAVGQHYTVKLDGKRMTWVGTEGQGTLVFQR